MTKRIAGQLWRSASILVLPKMTPRWPLTPNSWTPLLFPPPHQPDDHCIEILQKPIKAYSRRSILWFWTHRQIHACHKLSKFSLSPFALPPPKFWCWCHHCYYLLINKNYTFYRKTYISHVPYTLHHYLNKPHELHELACLNLFTLHHCFLLNPKPQFQNNMLQSGYKY